MIARMSIPHISSLKYSPDMTFFEAISTQVRWASSSTCLPCGSREAALHRASKGITESKERLREIDVLREEGLLIELFIETIMRRKQAKIQQEPYNTTRIDAG